MENSFFELSPPEERWRSESCFGLRDPGDGLVACSVDAQCGDIKGVHAVVLMTSGELRFAPIDHNPRYDAIAPANEPRCDGMVYSRTKRSVVFVELKDRKDASKNRRKWKASAIAQLRQTVIRFKAIELEADALVPSFHFAVAANKQSKYAAEYVTAARSRAFFMDEATFGFRLSISNTISLGDVL